MSNALTVPPPLTRRSVQAGPTLYRYRIRCGERTVGSVLATGRADALARFMVGRPKPPASVELRAYAIVDLDVERRRGGDGS